MSRIVNERFVPLISELPGLISYTAVEDENGVWTSISVFGTKEEAEHSNEMAAEWIKKNAPSFAIGIPEISIGEVTIHIEHARV